MSLITYDRPGKSIFRLFDNFLVRKKTDSIAKKNIHLQLRGESIDRLEHMSERFEPSTNTKTISVALQITEALLNQYDDGAKFFIQREGDNEPIEMEVFG